MSDRSNRHESSCPAGGDHYAKLAIKPWDAMEAWMTHDEFRGFLLGNVIKYLARKKEGTNDIEKAHHYIEKLLAFLKREEQAIATELPMTDKKCCHD